VLLRQHEESDTSAHHVIELLMNHQSALPGLVQTAGAMGGTVKTPQL
jgi:hypothetical protein